VIAVYQHGEHGILVMTRDNNSFSYIVIVSYGLLVFRYSDISLDEIQRICPACRGICNCKTCLRSDNSIKVFLFVSNLKFRLNKFLINTMKEDH